MPRISAAPTLPEQVADQLRRRIAAGEFPVGSLLPTEQQLMSELGVSRSSVREALRSLVHAGLLGARAGYGTFVCATNDVAPVLARRLDLERAADVAEVRLILEREGARLAAERATEAQCDELRKALQARLSVDDGPSYAKADIAFHQLLLEASGNALLAELYRGVGGNEQALLPLNNPDLDFKAESCALHEIDEAHATIVDAVLAEDPDAAATAAERTVELVHRYADNKTHRTTP